MPAPSASAKPAPPDVKAMGGKGAEGAPPARKNSLSSRLLRTILLLTVGLIVLLSLSFAYISYRTFEGEAEQLLQARANSLALAIDNSQASAELVLADQADDTTRYTLIASDGEVLYDSAADAQSMPNHSDRPEVQAAKASGTAVLERYSQTLQTDTVYAAALLDDGSVVRIAQSRESLLAYIGKMALPALIAVAVAVLVALLVSRVLARRILKPIDALDFTEPLNNDIYTEMAPLLSRIDEQQRQLKEQNAQLARAGDMRREFSGNVSHEMKSPLQVISGYAELMKSGVVSQEDNAKFAGIIYDEAQNMRALIDDILVLSKLDESDTRGEHTEMLDLSEMLSQEAARLQTFADESGIHMEVIGEKGIAFEGNRALFSQMFHNLAENAIRYNTQGGKVRMRLASTQDGGVRLEVDDSGAGIPPDQREQVFERFYRLDKSRSKETGGTGLGLAIVKHAALYHRGSVHIEDSPLGGARFVVEIPAAK